MRTRTSVRNARIHPSSRAGVRPQQAGLCTAGYGHSRSTSGISVLRSGPQRDWLTKKSACPTGLPRSGRVYTYAPTYRPWLRAAARSALKYGLTYEFPSVALTYANDTPLAATAAQSIGCTEWSWLDTSIPRTG